MNNKSVAKRYIISVLLLYFIGALLLFAFVFAVNEKGISHLTFTVHQMALISFLSAIVPTGSYTGFVFVGTKIGELTKKQMIIIVVFFPVMLALLTIFGIIMIIPCIIKSLITISKAKQPRG